MAQVGASYDAKPVWDIGRPQDAFVVLARNGAIQGKVLEVGCGTGELSLMAASMGLEVLGVDASPVAIAKAEAKAKERALNAHFKVWNVLMLQALEEKFDTVLDCGLFHALEDQDLTTFVSSLASVLRPGGRYLMLCFSDLQPGVFGPRRVTQDEIKSSFATGWRVDAIEPSRFFTSMTPNGALSWLASIEKT
jgi:2-polyprenyl-3-methyl-5-hydroxy-6-metoxy-1,4-benzoquinol methylase